MRQFLCVALAVAICASAGLSADNEKPRPELLTKENSAKVKAGMTLGEVEAILGKGIKMTRDQFAAEVGVSPTEFPEGDYFRWGMKEKNLTTCVKEGKVQMVARTGLE